MQGVTFTIAGIFILLVIALRPKYALAAYVTSMVWYPTYLAVSFGTIDVPVNRFVVFVLLLRCVLTPSISSKFTWCRLDTWMALAMAVFVIVPLLTYNETTSAIIENRGGFVFDTWFAYLVARYLITDRDSLISLIKVISIVLIPLAILGVIESVTHWQPFAPLRVYSPWYRGQAVVSEMRFGLSRALGPFGHAILFGCGFAMFLPLTYSLRHERDSWHSLAYALSVLMFFGALSCMSSGGWVMTIIVVICLAIEKHKDWVKRLIIFGILSCIFVGMASNRPFYHVIASWANPLGGAGWHRARLLDLFIEHFSEWWMYGYRGEDPGWGPQLGMGFTDITNEFVLVGVNYGILGVIGLAIITYMAFKTIINTYNKSADPYTKSICWAIGSLLFAIFVTWMSVSFFGQLMTLTYFMFGVIGSSMYFTKNEKAKVVRYILIDDRKALAI